MAPILNGAPGFILLTLSIGLGAYIRQVYVAATETYDKVAGGELSNLWPVHEQYTKDRPANIEDVQRKLRAATILMFIFISASSLRLVCYAINSIPDADKFFLRHLVVANAVLYYCDVIMTLYLLLSFLFMWRTHWTGSNKEREYHKTMHEALQKRREQEEFLKQRTE